MFDERVSVTTHSVSINVLGLASGLYTMTLDQEGGNVFTKKFIVARE